MKANSSATAGTRVTVPLLVMAVAVVSGTARGCHAAFAPMTAGSSGSAGGAVATFARGVQGAVMRRRRTMDFGVDSGRCAGLGGRRRGGGGGDRLLSMADMTPSAEASPSTGGGGGGGGNLHGQNACFLPLVQLDQDYYAPRIVQIAGAYPGLTADDLRAVTSEPSPPQGQWTYDFSDPDGPQVGTVALEGSMVVASCEDPVVVIAEHPSLGVDLPKELVDPVDLVVLVDRAKTGFAERKFLVVDVGGGELEICGYASKADMPPGAVILGQVEQVQIPWLPAMKATKSGFMEVDEYY